MKIQDLSKDLSQEERAVRGGSNANLALLGGPTLMNNVGPSLFSPQTNVMVDTPVVTQTNVAPITTSLDLSKITSVLGSLGTSIGQ